MAHRDALNAYLLALLGVVIVLGTWVPYWFALVSNSPPVAWSYMPLLVPEFVAAGAALCVAMMIRAGFYYERDAARSRNYVGVVAAVAYACAFISNGFAVWFMGSLWFVCVSDVASLNFEEYRACDTSAWSLWVQAAIAVLALVHSLWGLFTAAKAVAESQIDIRDALPRPPVGPSSVEAFGQSLQASSQKGAIGAQLPSAAAPATYQPWQYQQVPVQAAYPVSSAMDPRTAHASAHQRHFTPTRHK
jgi:hypothetical protein